MSDHILKTYDLANDDRLVPVGIDLVDRRLVRAGLVHRGVSGTLLACIALSKKRLAAVLSSFVASKKSTVLSFLFAVWQRYFHTPLTLM